MSISILSLWQRLPVIVRAVIAGLAVLLAGEVPWGGIAGHAGLAGWNGRVLVVVPWAIAPMAFYLWLYWRYLDGRGWPRLTARLRHAGLRANPLSSEVWGMSLLAGVVEETAFRGYMQGPVERRHGPIVAILVTGVIFGLLHYNHHPASVFAMLPFYIAVAAVYGGVTYLTNSIWQDPSSCRPRPRSHPDHERVR